jgi:hypothetical protein
MMEDYKKEDFDRLKNEVETLVGRKIVSPRDFDFLSRQIEGYTQETVSVSTLKRLWGYVACSCKPSRFNLELLSRMVGYPSWNAFVESKDAVASSRFFFKSKLIADALVVNDLVRLTWQPGRILTIKYLGNDNFKVMESLNSKLAAGGIRRYGRFRDGIDDSIRARCGGGIRGGEKKGHPAGTGRPREKKNERQAAQGLAGGVPGNIPHRPEDQEPQDGVRQ